MNLPYKKPLAVQTIIALNVFVFILWKVLGANDNGFMVKNFLVSWDSLKEGRYWTLLGAAFSHYMLLHIFINMFVLKGFGAVIEIVLGMKRFVIFYLVAGIFSSFAHAAVSAYILSQPEVPALGASGAISGVILLFSLMFPKEKILILGIIPAPALIGALIFVGLDVWGLVSQARGTAILPIGHGAHLGGALVGVLYYYFYVKRRASVNL